MSETRTAGNHWGGTRLGKELAQLPWKALLPSSTLGHIHLQGCEYCFLDRGDTAKYLPAAKQNFRVLSSFGSAEIAGVELREGEHGSELVNQLVREEVSSTAWLILGQAVHEDKTKGDGLMVWSAFPGELTASIKNMKSFNGTLGSLLVIDLPFAVKGI